jgi:hypothetical protein
MPDTRRSQSALTTLFADNTGGDISAQDGRDVIVSAHPESVVTTAAYASHPSTPLTGDLFLPTDGFSVERYSGSAWVPWGPLFPFTPLAPGDFTAVNQGGASLTATKNGAYLDAPATTPQSLRIWKRSAPGTPYTRTVALLPLMTPTATYGSGAVGMCFRDSAGGGLVTFNIQPQAVSGDPIIQVMSWSSPTASAGTYYNKTWRQSFPLFLRIGDDGTTNRTFAISFDGQNFVTVESHSRTNAITADEVGIFAQAPDNTYGIGCTFLSWA